MKNILINGLKAKAGGGKNIFDNYLQLLSNSSSSDKYFVLTPNKTDYQAYSKENIIIVDVRDIFKRNLLFPALYFYELPILLKKLKIDLIFNFGDVIIPSEIPQVYFFDWAYAVYPDDYIWKRMSIKDFIVRKTKVFLISKYISSVKVTIAQTNNIANRLKRFYHLDTVPVIPTPVGFDNCAQELDREFNLPSDKTKFLFPSSFAPHKNFDIIVSVGELIKTKNLPFVIVLTINEGDAKPFFSKIRNRQLNCVISVGKVAGSNMPSLYRQSDVVFFPTLLESFGLPYVEAMAYGKPIITSDMDFAHEVCGELADYFNPFDADSIVSVMEKVSSQRVESGERIKLGQARIAALPDWNEVFCSLQKQIELAIN
jgi:glycosyltransferase involved in cell wall biosynthesis